MAEEKMRPLKRPDPTSVETRDTPADYTATKAASRSLLINLWVIKYGTNDKIQGAAILFAILLFGLIALTIIFGMIHGENAWADRLFTWLSSTFLFVLGIAIGRAGIGQNENGNS